MAELYTKLFVQSERSHYDMLTLVAAASGGTVDATWTVVAGDYEMDVRPNEDSTQTRRTEHPHDFLYFPFTVEIVTDGDPQSPSEYLSFVGSLMKRLHADGMQIVAACDWEDDLPGAGRL